MEAYPPSYVEHNLPLVLLSGLGEIHIPESSRASLAKPESGPRLNVRSPVCEGDRPSHLLQQFLKHDGSSQPWNAGALPGPAGSIKYGIRVIGRVGRLDHICPCCPRIV
jgi:hypothetical protein